MFIRIMYVTVLVSDHDKALDFHTFGFQKHADYNGPEGRFLTIRPQGSRIRSLAVAGHAGSSNDDARGWLTLYPVRTISGETSPSSRRAALNSSNRSRRPIRSDCV
jgi:hypothetical protein